MQKYTCPYNTIGTIVPCHIQSCFKEMAWRNEYSKSTYAWCRWLHFWLKREMILKYYLTSCQTEKKGLPIISKLPLHAYKHGAYLVVRREHTLVAVILENDNNTLSIVTRSGSGGGGLCQLWCRVMSVMCAARPSTCFTTAKSCLTTVFEL